MEDYSTPFRPDFELGELSRSALARLAREYMLLGHLVDRSGLPQVLARYGIDAMREVSIDEWMGASPIWTQRMQKALRFEGDDVATIFKGLQLDIGFAHQFMDVRFEVTDAEHGEFWLRSCGALLDAEPMGEDIVHMMCHDIEDPTFPATAVATNPHAKVLPVHRPPRVPPDREPHCRWTTTIDPANEPAVEIPLTSRVRRSLLADVALAGGDGAASGGRDDYSGSFDPDFELEDLSHAALLTVCREFCVQTHLLVRSFMLCLAERHGDATSLDITGSQLVGIGALASERLASALRTGMSGIESVLRVLQLHPLFMPREYVSVGFERTDDHAGLIRIDPCDALSEGDLYSWFAVLGQDPAHRALDAIVQAVDPRAHCTPVPVPEGSLSWRVVVDPTAEPAPEPPELGLTRVSTGAAFQLVSRREV